MTPFPFIDIYTPVQRFTAESQHLNKLTCNLGRLLVSSLYRNKQHDTNKLNQKKGKLQRVNGGAHGHVLHSAFGNIRRDVSKNKTK